MSSMEKPPAYFNQPSSDHFPQFNLYPAASAPNFAGGAPVAMAPVTFSPPVEATTSAPNSAMVRFTDKPMTVVCNSCQERVQTMVEFETGGMTYLTCLGIACFLWCGCCLIPCCLDSCKDAHHYCPKCSAQVGIFKRL